jgi:hypothetical protein
MMVRFVTSLIPGIGAVIAAVVFMPRALVDRGPYLQIVGHYSQAGMDPVAIGSGPGADLRLTESGVAELHGWLRRDAGTLQYVHATTAASSQRIRSGLFPGEHWNSFERLQSGDRVRIVDQDGRERRKDVVTLVNARTIEFTARNGETRKTLVPEIDGHGTALADYDGNARSWLIRCRGRLGFSPADDCVNFVPFSRLQRTAMAWAISVDPPARAAIPRWLAGGTIRAGRELKNAFARVENATGTKQLRFLPEVNGPVAAAPEEGYVLYRRGRRNPLPRIARTAPLHHEVKIVRDGGEIPVGQTDVADGDILSLGDTYFRVSYKAGDPVVLHAVEKYDRFHFFYSLSAGRLNFANRIRTLSKGTDELTIEGTRGISSSAALRPVDTQRHRAPAASWRLPIPRWIVPAPPPGAAAGAVADHVRVRIASVRADAAGDSAEFSPAAQNRWPDELFPPARLNAGAAAQFAGHVFTYQRTTPLFEQRFPAIAMCMALLVLGAVAANSIFDITLRISRASFRTPLRAFVLIALACIAFLLIVGVLLMSRMAVLDTVVGKADYYHRQLFYSFLTAVIVTAILAGLRRSGRAGALATPAWMGFPFSLTVMIGSVLLLLMWQLIDYAAFSRMTNTAVAAGPITVQLVAAAILLLLFAVMGSSVLFLEGRRRIVYFAIASAEVAALATKAFWEGMILIGGVAVGIVVLWLIVLLVASAPPVSSLQEIEAQQELEGNSVLRRWKGRAYETWRRIGMTWGDLQARPKLLIATGLLILASGGLLGSGRDSVGVKPAEFAVWFLGPGLCAMLAFDFRRQADVEDEGRKRELLGPGWPGWIVQSTAAMQSAWRWLANLLSRYGLQTLIGLLAAAMVGLLVFYRNLIAPPLVVAGVVPLLLLALFVWWVNRPSSDGGEGDDAQTTRELLRDPTRLYAPVLLTIIAIQVLVIIFYVFQGDFGPLLVLVPSVAFLTFVWAFLPDYEQHAEEQAAPAPDPAAMERDLLLADADDDAAAAPSDAAIAAAAAAAARTAAAKRDAKLRFAVMALFLIACLWGGLLAHQLVQSPFAAEIGGPSVTRATKRFLTRSTPWYTKEGSWSTESLWIANHYFKREFNRERMLANLHSDLAFVALVQSFGYGLALVVLGVYALLVGFSFASLGVKSTQWSGFHENATLRLQSRRTSLLLYFAGAYLLAELIVHVGSALNAIWQTGVTLPWISSGGSASLGFGGLCAIALALAVSGLSAQGEAR